MRHYTSRAGDPHRHLHLQINARVFAAGAWRGLHSVGVVDSIEALNGIGHAAVLCDPEFRTALAAHGYTLDDSGEVAELTPYAGRFSERSSQIARNIDRYEAQWRADHPGQEPGPKLRRSWDRRAWAEARPDKVTPKDGSELVKRWNEELHELGFRAPAPPADGPCPSGSERLKGSVPAIGAINRDVAVELILLRLGAKRSAWNAADIRGEAEKVIASVGVIAERGIRTELAEDLTARAVDACRPLRERPDVPEHIRNLTSDRVLAVEAELVDTIAARSQRPVVPARRVRGTGHLDRAQQQVVAALAGDAALLVIEGAAGAGKTATLAAARGAGPPARGRHADAQGGTSRSQRGGHRCVFRGMARSSARVPMGRRRLLVARRRHPRAQRSAASRRCAPGRRGRDARPGHRSRTVSRSPNRLAPLSRSSATATSCPPLDAAASSTSPRDGDGRRRTSSLSRCTASAIRSTPTSACGCARAGGPARSSTRCSSAARSSSIPSEVERTAVLADVGSRGDELIIADTREQVASINAAIRDRRLAGGERTGELVTRRGERIGLGDRIATRRNDRDLGVANRDVWTVAGVGDDGSLVVVGRTGQRVLAGARSAPRSRHRALPLLAGLDRPALPLGPRRSRWPDSFCPIRGSRCCVSPVREHARSRTEGVDMTIKPLGVPDEGDDNHILMFEEFCAFIRTPQRTVREWRRPQARPALVAFQRQQAPLHKPWPSCAAS